MEEELKNQRSTQKERNRVNEALLRQYKGEEEESEGGISVDRLE